MDFDYGVIEPAAAVQFRFVTDSDWLGMAGSRVYIDPRQSALVGAARFGDLPLGQRLYSLIVPLHAGRGVTPTYLAVLLFFTALGDGNDVLGRRQLPAQASEAPQARRVGRGRPGWRR